MGFHAFDQSYIFPIVAARFFTMGDFYEVARGLWLTGYTHFNPPKLCCLKENGQNPDNGSKNSENQNNDAVL